MLRSIFLTTTSVLIASTASAQDTSHRADLVAKVFFGAAPGVTHGGGGMTGTFVQDGPGTFTIDASGTSLSMNIAEESECFFRGETLVNGELAARFEVDATRLGEISPETRSSEGEVNSLVVYASPNVVSAWGADGKEVPMSDDRQSFPITSTLSAADLQLAAEQLVSECSEDVAQAEDVPPSSADSSNQPAEATMTSETAEGAGTVPAFLIGSWGQDCSDPEVLFGERTFSWYESLLGGGTKEHTYEVSEVVTEGDQIRVTFDPEAPVTDTYRYRDHMLYFVKREFAMGSSTKRNPAAWQHCED